MAGLKTLYSFSGGGDGDNLRGDLFADSNGDLFGTAYEGGANDEGVVFEIVKTANGYASTPAILFSFSGSDGANPFAGLSADANGDLFGTTNSGGANGDGTVFEIAKTANGYSNTPTTLWSFTGGVDGRSPTAGLLVDGNGDLFGTAEYGGANGDGAVFEIAETANGYASTPTTLWSFAASQGGFPYGGLATDGNGDLFGAAFEGGLHGAGAVFEIAKTANGYANTPTVLWAFTGGSDGGYPYGGLIVDANGDLFGTTVDGGTNNDGVVFEIAKTANGYANTVTVLWSFTGGSDGGEPYAGLISDAHGDLFGTTAEGGTSGDGTVFEIAKTATGYASAPTVLFSFDDKDGAEPLAGLIADANGDLFGTTNTGGSGGTAFEVMPATDDFNRDGLSDLLLESGSGAVVSSEVVSGALISTQVAGLGSGWSFGGNGDFLGDGGEDFLILNASGALVAGEVVNGATSYTQIGGLGSGWSFVGTGDYLNNGQDQFLIENVSGAVVVGNVVNGQAQYTQVAGLGPEWSFEGSGNFLGDGMTDFLIENDAGTVDVGEVSNGTTTYTQVAGLGSEWKFVGTGDFLGDGHDQFLMESTSGVTQSALVLGNVVNGQAKYTQVGLVGSGWSFLGAGDYLGNGVASFMIETAAGVVEVGAISNGQASYAQVGALGSGWTSHS